MKFNTKDDVRFYYYDTSVKKYKLLKNTKAKIDKNGYLHFSTSIGGQIVISDGTLKK